ncbi:MAG: V-type ATP synthase subunit E [Patescibacteria group bacterium]
MGEAEALTTSVINLAKAEAAGILAGAEAKAASRLAEAHREAASRAAAIEAEAERRAALEDQRIATGAELQVRRDLLHAKVALLDEVFDAAYGALAELSEDEWRQLMCRLLCESAVTGTETVAVPAGQQDRFAALLPEVNERLRAGGRKGELSIAGEGAPIEHGFVIVAQDYTVDCSFRKLLAERRAALEPEVARVLFNA